MTLLKEFETLKQVNEFLADGTKMFVEVKELRGKIVLVYDELSNEIKELISDVKNKRFTEIVPDVKEIIETVQENASVASDVKEVIEDWKSLGLVNNVKDVINTITGKNNP